MVFEQLQANILSVDPWSVLKPILRKYIPEILDANTGQLERGQLSDGDLLETYKDPVYADFKKTLSTYKAPDGVPDLQVTGDFYEAFFGEVTDTGLVIGSKDDKTEKLERMYSKDIFGLQPEEWQKLKTDYILPEYITELKKIILKR